MVIADLHSGQAVSLGAVAYATVAGEAPRSKAQPHSPKQSVHPHWPSPGSQGLPNAGSMLVSEVPRVSADRANDR